MSDEEKEVDIESDEADKRAHHNALERKRRDHIKDSFAHLRDSIPSLQGEKASRAQILNKATDYIQFMRRKNHTHQNDIDDLKRQNLILDQQVRSLEKARTTGQFNSEATSALLSSTDSLLNTSGTDLLLDTALKTEPLPAIDPLLSVDAVVGHDDSKSADGSDDDYGGKVKRRKRDT